MWAVFHLFFHIEAISRFSFQALARKGGLRPIRKDAKIEDPRPAPVFEQAVRK